MDVSVKKKKKKLEYKRNDRVTACENPPSVSKTIFEESVLKNVQDLMAVFRIQA